MKHSLWFLLLALVVILSTVPAGATLTDVPSEEVSAEIVELNEGPTELDYLESINTYVMYIFAFGVVWIILKVGSLVYKLLRIFI